VVKWNDILIATMAHRRDLRVFARDRHFDTMRDVLGLRLYQPGYNGMYNPGRVSLLRPPLRRRPWPALRSALHEHPYPQDS